jgi:hypothetical protein
MTDFSQLEYRSRFALGQKTGEILLAADCRDSHNWNHECCAATRVRNTLRRILGPVAHPGAKVRHEPNVRRASGESYACPVSQSNSRAWVFDTRLIHLVLPIVFAWFALAAGKAADLWENRIFQENWPKPLDFRELSAIKAAFAGRGRRCHCWGQSVLTKVADVPTRAKIAATP